MGSEVFIRTYASDQSLLILLLFNGTSVDCCTDSPDFQWHFTHLSLLSLSPFTARSASARARRTEREGSGITSPSKYWHFHLHPSIRPSIRTFSTRTTHLSVHISEKPSTITVIHPDLVIVKVYTAFTNFYCTIPVKYYGSHWPLAEGCGNTEGRAGTVFFLGNCW